MYKTMIIEDDPFARQMLVDLLGGHADYSVVGMEDSVQAALASIPRLEPDLVFLDMELTDGKGFDILELLPQINFETIITTQHDSFMLDAIRHSALDYILKPVKRTALAEALSRFERRIKEKPAPAGGSPAFGSQKIVLSMNTEMVFLDAPDIIRLESDGSYTHFHTLDKKKYTTSRTLATYEARLLPLGFFRVHQKHLINLAQIDKYVRGDGGYVIMSDGTTVEVSRRKKDDFLRALGV